MTHLRNLWQRQALSALCVLLLIGPGLVGCTPATNAADSGDLYGNQSWNYVGSGGSNFGLRNGKNPYAAPLEPHGFNDPGADYSGYAVPPRS